VVPLANDDRRAAANRSADARVADAISIISSETDDDDDDAAAVTIVE
jgi:hypothetical protein